MHIRDDLSTAVARMKAVIRCAGGDQAPDLVLRNARIANVFTGEFLEGDVAIVGDRIAGIGRYRGPNEVDLEGRYCCPGFIDGHIHIESSMLEPRQFAAAVVPHGTTAVICDPHEIANVLGLSGVEYMLARSRGIPLDVFVMAPSCVPATHMESSGADLDGASVDRMLDMPGVIGLAEMMNFPATVAGDSAVLDKIARSAIRGLPVDGHAPGVSGRDLQAYCAAGIGSDHECTTLEEGQEKLRAGMHLFIREGSTAKNLAALLPLVTPATASRCLLVSDDRHPDDLVQDGHLDAILRRAVQLGLDPMTALRMVTLNPARYFGLAGRGAVAPGWLADLVILDNLEQFSVLAVYKRGREVVHPGGKMTETGSSGDTAHPARDSVHLGIQPLDLTIPARNTGRIRVIECIEHQIVTRAALIEPTVRDGCVVADPAGDLAKLAVCERHRGTGRLGLGFVRGLGIQRGAIASTVAHDSHNLIVAGISDQAMRLAVIELERLGGGLVVTDDDSVLAALPLPIAGLMTDAPVSTVVETLVRLRAAAGQLGTDLANPFMLLSFLALPVIPEIKLTDRGLIDVNRFQPVSLWE